MACGRVQSGVCLHGIEREFEKSWWSRRRIISLGVWFIAMIVLGSCVRIYILVGRSIIALREVCLAHYTDKNAMA